MGQAFDADGRVVGEAFDETKRAVFDRLMRDHPDAHELRIKTLAADPNHDAGPTTDAVTPAPRDRLEQFFRWDHLPPRLQVVSAPFGDLAGHMLRTLPSNPERTVMLRKLLEAKDCAVRALLFEG